MKKIIKKSAITFFVVILILSSILLTFAAEVNSNPANVGDTVTYELRVNPCPDRIQALDIVIYYDSTSLEYIPYSLELPNISGFMTNTNIDGEIRYNAMDFEGFSFDEDKILSTVQFTVKDTTAQNLNLTYEIRSFIDSNTTDLGNTYTYDVTSVNGGVDRNPQNNNSSLFPTDNDILDSDISTDSDLLENTDTDSGDITSDTISEITSDTDTNSETDTDTDTNSDNIFNSIDNFEEFLSEPISSVSSDKTSSVSSQTTNANNQNNTKLYIIATVVAIVIIFVIGFIFTIIAKRSNNGSHFS